jgi:hypothetical protein
MIDGTLPALFRRSCCPCCESTDHEVIVKESYENAALRDFLVRHYEGRANTAVLTDCWYELVRCRDCGFAYQQTVPRDSLLEEVYEEWIPPSERDRLHRERDLDDYRYLSEQVQFLIQHLGRRPFEIRVLDFGMGWAEWASMARAFGCQVAGSELSEHRVRHAQSVGIEVVTSNDLNHRRFHFINTEQVFEHLIQPLSTLKHLANALERGGVIRISVPNARAALRTAMRRRSFTGLQPKHVMPLQPLEHVNCFDHQSLVALGRHAGLQLIRPSLQHVYNSSSGWFRMKGAVHLALRPIYRHIFPKSTVAYFGRD